jgi:uncharacterized protein (DUF1800 family)
MKHWALTVVLAALLTSIPNQGSATGPFDQKLSPDKKISQALNRLTFGPRPGEVEQVRRLGVAKWIDLQLHPERIPENPALEAKLKPLESLRLDLPAVVKDYNKTPDSRMMAMVAQPPRMNELLPRADMLKVQNGAEEERTAVLDGLDPDKRKQVLLQLSPDILKYTPKYKQEAEDARKAQAEERQKENRKRNPQLSDLLNADDLKMARSGNKEQLIQLFANLDPDKRPVVASLLPQPSLAALPELRREGRMYRSPPLVASDDVKEAKVLRALYSNRQLEEVLVDFWYNHFNVDQAKSVSRSGNLLHTLIGNYERDAIRPHVLGHFKDLLLATARHPAMVIYLDNWQSMAPDGVEIGPFAPNRGFFNGVPNSIIPGPFSRQAHGLNENYGREVMELHTLGVKGGYTQKDVIEVARCFTGWTVRSPDDPEFIFAPFMHDFGEKTVLGRKIAAGGGEQDGLKVIDILAHHPSTAKFISRELAQRFVADNPPQALVDRMAQTFLKTDGDLRAVLRVMFLSPEFSSVGAWQTKVKSPFEMVVSAVRAVSGETTDAYTLVQRIAELGEPLYAKVEPNGYPNTGDGWLSTSGLMARMNFSTALTAGHIPGVTVDLSKPEPNPGAKPGAKRDPAAIARDLLGRDASPQTMAALEKGLANLDQPPPFIASLVLASPDFQRR